MDRGAVTAQKSRSDATPVIRKPSTDDPLAALVFKIVADKPLDLYYIRIYSGTLKSGSRVLNAERSLKENISRIHRMFAKRREVINSAGPGDIVAVVGLKDSLTGDTLCDPKQPCVLEAIEFPEPVISVAVEPRSSQDRDAMSETLQRLSRQDPTFGSLICAGGRPRRPSLAPSATISTCTLPSRDQSRRLKPSADVSPETPALITSNV